MKLPALLLSSIIALSFPTAAFRAMIVNHCSETLYIWTDAQSNDCPSPPCSAAELELPPSATYTAPYGPSADAASVTIKIAKQHAKDTGNAIYLVEFSQADGKLGYNFSHEGQSSNPFLNEARTLTCPGGPALACAPGSEGCDWPAYAQCPYPGGDLVATMCA